MTQKIAQTSSQIPQIHPPHQLDVHVVIVVFILCALVVALMVEVPSSWLMVFGMALTQLMVGMRVNLNIIQNAFQMLLRIWLTIPWTHLSRRTSA